MKPRNIRERALTVETASFPPCCSSVLTLMSHQTSRASKPKTLPRTFDHPETLQSSSHSFTSQSSLSTRCLYPSPRLPQPEDRTSTMYIHRGLWQNTCWRSRTCSCSNRPEQPDSSGDTGCGVVYLAQISTSSYFLSYTL